MFFKKSWRKRLSPATISPKDFEVAVCDCFREMDPQCIVKVVGDFDLQLTAAGERDVQVHIGNVYANLPGDPAARVSEVERFVRTTLRPGVPTVDARLIVPQVKSTAYLEEIARASKGEFVPVTEPLIADLHILYAQDEPDAVHPLRADHLAELGLTLEQLRPIAIQNLWRLLADIEIHGGPAFGMVVCGGTYESSLLLSDNVWDTVQGTMTGEVLACTPARDLMFFADSAQPNGVKSLYEAIANAARAGYHVSTTVLVRRSGKWAVFDHSRHN